MRSTFLTFRRCLPVRVAGLAETLPSFPVSGPFLPDVPGFQVPPDLYLSTSTSVSLSGASSPSSFQQLLGCLQFHHSLLFACLNHSSILMTIAIGSIFASSKISSFLRCSNRLTPITNRTILVSVVAIRFSSLTDIGHVSQP